MTSSHKHNKYDETYTKPSRHKLWTEKSAAPLTQQKITMEEIAELKVLFAHSYKCPVKDITHRFTKISDDQDPEKATHVCLQLFQDRICRDTGTIVKTEIYSLKIPMPDELIARAKEEIRRTAPLALSSEEQQNRPTLRRPMHSTK
jgi:hypothetical protein